MYLTVKIQQQSIVRIFAHIVSMKQQQVLLQIQIRLIYWNGVDFLSRYNVLFVGKLRMYDFGATIKYRTEVLNMKHVFVATKLGWGKEREGVWFDSSQYTKEEAIAEFKPFKGTTQRGYPYTGYEYDGQKYHDVTYIGEFEDDELPRNDIDVMDSIIGQSKR